VGLNHLDRQLLYLVRIWQPNDVIYLSSILIKTIKQGYLR
jgi:hypothetical protein